MLPNPAKNHNAKRSADVDAVHGRLNRAHNDEHCSGEIALTACGDTKSQLFNS